MKKFKVTNIGKPGVIAVNSSVRGQKQLSLISGKTVTLAEHEYKLYAVALSKFSRYVEVKLGGKAEPKTTEAPKVDPVVDGPVANAEPAKKKVRKKRTKKKAAKKATKKVTKKV